jgi:glycosyltransferase involved in cell wall biosynthesis
MVRLFFLIRSLEAGGAERQLIELMRGLDKQRFSVAVATFYDGGAFRSEVEAIEGVRLYSLGKRTRWDLAGFFYRLLGLIRREQSDIIYGQLWTANVVALAAGRLSRKRVVWSVRAASTDFTQYDRLAKWLFDLSALLSRFPDLIIANSFAGREYHIENGFARQNLIVIPNGIDTDRYLFDPAARGRIRGEWGVREDEKVIGMMARIDPMKDHGMFLEAAASLAAARQDIRFVCVGGGEPAWVERMHETSRALGLEGRVIWAGFRRDVGECYSAFDLLVSSSYGEGFPNVVAEAMSTGLECVVTDVGDSAVIIGDTGRVVPPKDVPALAAACEALLAKSSDRSATARERIVREFSIRKLSDATAAALERLG